MKTCAPCPSTMGNLHGHDPEALDILEGIHAGECPEDTAHLWCPWEKRICPLSIRNGKTATRCGQAGIKVPFRLHETFMRN